jgi:hypothetical protein
VSQPVQLQLSFEGLSGGPPSRPPDAVEPSFSAPVHADVSRLVARLLLSLVEPLADSVETGGSDDER